MLKLLTRLRADFPYVCWALPVLTASSLIIAVMVKFVPLPRLPRILKRIPGLSRVCLPTEHTWSLADLATRLIRGQGRCLNRSLLLGWLLGARGESVDILVGVRRDGGAFRSHAWIEARGRVLGEGPGTVDGFGTILRLSSS